MSCSLKLRFRRSGGRLGFRALRLKLLQFSFRGLRFGVCPAVFQAQTLKIGFPSALLAWARFPAHWDYVWGPKSQVKGPGWSRCPVKE